MFKYYLKTTIRQILKNKLYSMINIVGLAIGLATAIIIGIYIFRELSFDNFHEKSDRIYRIGTFMEFGNNPFSLASTNFTAGPEFVQNFAEVENSVRMRKMMNDTPILYKEKKFIEKDVFHVDPSFFEIFSFKLIEGDPKTVLANPYSVVLSKQIADKIFENENPVGKYLKVADAKQLFTVTGIAEDTPKNSHFNFSMLCSFESMREKIGDYQMGRWMGDFQNYTYILLNKQNDYKSVQAQIPALIDKNVGDLLRALNGKLELFLQPLDKIYLHSNALNEIGLKGDIRYIYLFSSIAFLIILIACINFLNLSTARATTRTKEVGIKKTHGAPRKELAFQFMWEAFFYVLLAIVIAFLLIASSWKVINDLTGLDSSIFFKNSVYFLTGLIGLLFIVTIMAGSYPAFYLSSFHPVHSLKESKIGNRRSRFRNALVLIQFIISISLVSCTIIILNQLEFLQNKKLGFKKENIVLVPYDYEKSLRSVESLKNDLLKNPDIINVTTTSNVPGEPGRANVFCPEGFTLKEAPMVFAVNADHDFLETMNIELVDGRNFSENFPADKKNSVIINETAVKKFGWENPIGKKITELVGNGITKTVIGVIKDYHYTPLYFKIDPLIIENEDHGENHRTNFFVVSIAPTHIKKSLYYVQSILENKNSLFPYQFSFLDEHLNNEYISQRKISHIFLSFTIVAIFLACLGLFGLVAYTTEQRTKEIGIRKVLGAKINSIVFALTSDFVKWVLIANIIGLPIAWYAMDKWLQNFAYRINMGWWMFLLGGGIALLIALFTVSWQAIRTATANPIESLRYE